MTPIVFKPSTVRSVEVLKAWLGPSRAKRSPLGRGDHIKATRPRNQTWELDQGS